MKTDLKSMTRKELEKLQVDIEKTIVRVAEREKKAALAAAVKAAKAHGFTLAEISGAPVSAKPKRKPGKKPKKLAAPKFANPADATQTWSGKGRPPSWFKDALASGALADELQI